MSHKELDKRIKLSGVIHIFDRNGNSVTDPIKSGKLEDANNYKFDRKSNKSDS